MDNGVKPAPAVKLMPLSSKPNAPINSSSGKVVVGVLPELIDIALPVATFVLSPGKGVTRSGKEMNRAALALGVVVGKFTVIVPPDKALTTGAENTRVRTPVVTEPFDKSASLV